MCLRNNFKRKKAWYLLHADQVRNKQLQRFLRAVLSAPHQGAKAYAGHQSGRTQCVLFIQGFFGSHNLYVLFLRGTCQTSFSICWYPNALNGKKNKKAACGGKKKYMPALWAIMSGSLTLLRENKMINTRRKLATGRQDKSYSFN